MRTLTMSVLLGLLIATACPAQEADLNAHLQVLARVLNGMMDMQVLGTFAALQLTDAQLQALAALYEQYHFEQPKLETAVAAAEKVEAVRKQLIAGVELKPADQEDLQKALQSAFMLFNPGQGEPVTELTPQDTMSWGILMPEQQGKIMGGQDPRTASLRAMQTIAKSREAEEETWTKFRDQMVALLSANAGAEGTPARQNSRDMFLEFFNRIRVMTAGDFAKKQMELAAELQALLPPGTNLGAALMSLDPGLIHQSLGSSLLSPRAPALVKEIQAARAAKASGQ